MSIAKIRSALTQAFVTGAFFTSDKVSWGNIPFTTPTGEPWAAVWFVPNAPTVATLGSGGEDNVDGFLQIDLNYPLNSGLKDAEDKAEAIRLVFPAGSRFTYSGVTAVVKSCGRSAGRKVDGFFRIVVTVGFYSHINR